MASSPLPTVWSGFRKPPARSARLKNSVSFRSSPARRITRLSAAVIRALDPVVGRARADCNRRTRFRIGAQEYERPFKRLGARPRKKQLGIVLIRAKVNA